MAITYNIAKCKGGYGVYIRAISGEDLLSLSPNSDVSVVRVTSGRLARKRSKQAAKNFIVRLKDEPAEVQRQRLLNTWIKIVPRDYKVVKVQNLKLFRETDNGEFIPLLSTANKNYAEHLALFYSGERNKQSFLRKTTTKHLKLPLNTNTDNLNEV
jgi:hypothetical protein